MVCQAASQTRFRALKHENGVAGSATIIVRVIACFQPLCDCQYKQSQSKAWNHPSCANCFVLMGKDFESWVPQWQPDGQFPNAKYLKLPVDMGMQNTSIPCAMPCMDTRPTNCGLPTFGFSRMPDLKPGQPRAPLFSLDKFLPKINLPNENCGEVNTPIASGINAPKKFLVFDQTGNKTTMIFSSGFGTPIQKPNPWSPKPASGHFNVSEEDLAIDEFDEGSDMREDTEEINALLYSDLEDNDIEDGEETSTGHSPSTMYEEEDMDEVASSWGPVKRRRLSHNSYELPSITNTSSSVNPNRSMDYENDAESSCAGGKPSRFGSMGLLSGTKRLRKEKIRETVDILQTIIPGGKGKDAVMVLDEAIHYLKTLKFKAQSLGFSA